MSDPVVDALRLGKAMEREAIVAWIRMNDPDWPVIDIERGEHLQDAPTEPKGPCGTCRVCEATSSPSRPTTSRAAHTWQATMSEQLHAGCHAALEAQAVDFRAALANERQRQTANALVGAELRYLLAPGVKRKTYRREMLEALVAAADQRAGR